MRPLATLVALVTLAACSKDAGPAPSPLVATSRALADKMCACRDAACATAVDAEWNEVAKDQASRQLSADDVDALAEATQRYAKCLAAARP